MSALTKTTEKTAIAPVNFPSAQVVLPKINVQGKAIMTAIDAGFIKGCESTTVTYQGKKYPGTKVYTVAGTFFKVMSTPANVIAAKHHASVYGELVTVDAVTALPGYSKVKALPAPKK